MIFAEEIASRLAPADALEAVERTLVEECAQVEHPDELTVKARLGSRLTFRVWGTFGPGRHQLPAVVEACIEAAPLGSRIKLDLISDEGRGYLFRASWAEAAYRKRFDQLVSQISREASGSPA